MAEAKHLQSPVHFALLRGSSSSDSGVALAVENRYGFLPLDRLSFTWALRSDAGGRLASGTLAVPAGVAPGETVEVSVLSAEAARAAAAALSVAGLGGGDGEKVDVGTPKRSPSSSALSPGKWLLKRNGSKDGGSSQKLDKDGAGASAHGPCGAVWLEATAALATAEPWAPQGHIVAQQSFPLSFAPGSTAAMLAAPTAGMPPLVLASEPPPAAAAGEDPAVFAVRGQDVVVMVGKRTGRLLRYEVKGQARIVGSVEPTPALVRACTDNDRAGFPVSATFVTPKWLCDFLEPYSPWAQ